MVGIIIEDEAAVEERERLLQDGTEISVTVKERDDQGNKKTTLLKFGIGGCVGWVFCEEKDEGTDPRTTLEEVLIHEAAELFEGYIERMQLRKGLVDPSPLSPAFVEVQPGVADIVEVLNAEFAVEISLR